jgi:hypothetical protein
MQANATIMHHLGQLISVLSASPAHEEGEQLLVPLC